MGLDFTSTKDEPGASIYFIHDGTEPDADNFARLIDDVSHRTKKQCILMSIKDKDAAKIIAFYQLKGSHFVLIIRDDDSLHHVWSDGERFDPSQIAYVAEQAG